MKFSKILTVCEANICRSPLAQGFFSRRPDLSVDSAGLTARPDDVADPVYVEMASQAGLDLTTHRSKPLTRELLASHDLILVMTAGQRTRITEKYPEFSGKIFLLGHWLQDTDSISDPHKKSHEAYAQVFGQIKDACTRWCERL